MFLLKKVFQLRDHVNPENEKPFLDHLEDLRVMVFKVAITLIISMIVCFLFQKELMDILQRPITQVMKDTAEEQLKHPPIPITPERWDTAKQAEHAAAGLPAPERDLYYRTLANPDIQMHARIVGLQRAAAALPAEKRAAFLAEIAPDAKAEFTHDATAGAVPNAKIREQVLFLIERKVSPEVAVRGDLRMMSTLKPTESFMLSMKLAFFAGIILAFPLLLVFILQFIIPGLHTHERKVLWPALTIAFGLFLIGVGFAYFLVLPKALEFFYQYSISLGVANEWRIGDYISFATSFTLLFGVAFELPVVIMVIVKLGLLSYKTMSKTRSYAIVGIMVVAAILTPTPDVITLSLMAGPMYFLYEVCIWLAWFHERKQKQTEDAEAKERMERLLRDYEEHEDIRTEHNSENADQAEHLPEHGDDGWKAEETPEHDPYHDYHDYHAEHQAETPEPPKVEELPDSAETTEEKPAADAPDTDINPEDEERRRSDR